MSATKSKLDLSGVESILSVQIDAAASAEAAYGKRNAVDGKARAFSDTQRAATVREGMNPAVRDAIVEACVEAVLKAS